MKCFKAGSFFGCAVAIGCLATAVQVNAVTVTFDRHVEADNINTDTDGNRPFFPDNYNDGTRIFTNGQGYFGSVLPNTANTTTVQHSDQGIGGDNTNGFPMGVGFNFGIEFDITITKPHPWHNALHGLDVTGKNDQPDNAVVAGDALAIINYINTHESGAIPSDATPGPPYYDTVNAAGLPVGDNQVVPADALAIINYINGSGAGHPGPEGEAAAPSASMVLNHFATAAPNDWLVWLALDVATQSIRRRS